MNSSIVSTDDAGVRPHEGYHEEPGFLLGCKFAAEVDISDSATVGAAANGVLKQADREGERPTARPSRSQVVQLKPNKNNRCSNVVAICADQRAHSGVMPCSRPGNL